ncbi:MAG: hypothetical protein V9E94_05380 [Microthrixaceae bacterium]
MHHNELVATEAPNGDIGAHQSKQALANFDEDRVTGGVTVPIVDSLESVEIQEQHCRCLHLKLAAEFLEDSLPVGQPS